MGLFGEKCVRCGRKRTRKEFEGVPTCDECMAQIELSREHIITCPVDGTAMEKIVRSNVVLDRCPSCQGIWFDGGELEVVERAAAAGGSDFTTGFIMGMVIG